MFAQASAANSSRRRGQSSATCPRALPWNVNRLQAAGTIPHASTGVGAAHPLQRRHAPRRAELDLPEPFDDLRSGRHGAELSAKPFLAFVLGSGSRGCRTVTLTSTYCCCPNSRAQHIVVCP